MRVTASWAIDPSIDTSVGVGLDWYLSNDTDSFKYESVALVCFVYELRQACPSKPIDDTVALKGEVYAHYIDCMDKYFANITSQV